MYYNPSMKRILWVVPAACTALNLWILSLVHPVTENITALGHTYGMSWLLALYTFFTGFFFWLFTSWLFKKEHRSKSVLRQLLISCICIAVSGLFPYFPNGSPFLNDLHVWVCVIGCAWYFLLWIYPVLTGQKPMDSITLGIVLCFAIGLCLFALTKHMSALMEAIPNALIIWTLYFACIGYINSKPRKDTQE